MNRLFAMLAIVLLVGASHAQADPALTKHHDEAGKRMAAAAARAKAANKVVRDAVAEPGRITDDLAEIDAKIAAAEFDAGLGQWAITIDRLNDLAEEKRPASIAAMGKLRVELTAASTAQLGQTAIKELIDRLEPLKGQLDGGDDLANPLKNLAESLARAELSEALPRPAIVALRGQLASTRAAYAARIAKEMLALATMTLAELDAAMPDLRKEFAAGEVGTRDSAHAKFADAHRAITTALARVPEADAAAKKLRDQLSKHAAEQRAVYGKFYGDALAAALKENFEFTADQFAEWEKEAEAVAPTAAEYINLDGSHYSVFNLPRTAAYVDRSNLFLTQVGTQENVLDILDHAKIKALLDGVKKDRGIALDRAHKLAEALVAEMEKTPIETDTARDRFAVLADTDLRVVLQEDPRQWALIARVHKLIDAYDLKALGDDKALAKRRQIASESATANWTRMYQRVPSFGGFDPLHAGLFKGKVMRIENLHDFSASFKPDKHDFVLDMDGQYFAATFDPAVKKELAVQLARAKAKITPGDGLELLMLVGDESTLTLLPAAGKEKGVDVPCRMMTIVGIKFGPVAIIAR